MTNEEIMERTKEEIRLRGLSKHTENEYMDKLRIFMRYYEDEPICDMTEKEIRAFLLYQNDVKHAAAGTINVYNSALRFVFGAILQRTLNYQMIPRKRIHRELPEIMSKQEVARFLACIDNLRDKTIFSTVYASGLRLCEIIRLRVQDIDSEGMRLFVHQGKGGKDRYTLLSQANLELLREYWKGYRPNHPDGYLFYPKHNKQRIMTQRTVQDAMKKHLKNAGILKHYTVHTLRHCFATHLLEAGVDICRIKQLMGHTHIQSTTFYLHLLNFDGSVKSPLDTLPKKRGRKSKVKSDD